MSGINAIASKLRNLLKKTKPEIKKVSVIFYDIDGTFDVPENVNDGVLLVPKPMTMEEWELYCIKEMG